jgi:ABC-type branched-subunit amino acid transport system ATPase component
VTSSAAATPVLQIESLTKNYGGLRPLRLNRLTLAPGEQVALAGFDQAMAETFVNLVTGAIVPDDGAVQIFGRVTADISDSADWLATVDRFGIVSERVVLLDQYSLGQNIAMSLTLDIEPIPDAVRADIVALGEEVGLAAGALDQPVQAASVATGHRVRLARAIATRPAVLLVEHPIAGLSPSEIEPFARDLSRVATGRGIALVVLAATAELARPFAPRVLALNGGTGDLSDVTRGGVLRRLFGR